MSGGSGDDWIEAGAGRNTLSGGFGADTFVFLSGNGSHHDTISDFQSYGEKADSLDISDFLVLQSNESAEAWQSENVSLLENGSVFVQLGYGQTVTLETDGGFAASDYDAICDTFVF